MARNLVAMETKLAVVFSSGADINVTTVCARLEISRQTFYKYRRRYWADGVLGLVERSRAPHPVARGDPGRGRDAIVRLRKELEFEEGVYSEDAHCGPDRIGRIQWTSP